MAHAESGGTDPVTGLSLDSTYLLPSDSEIRLLAAIVEGAGVDGAAAVLGISPGTVAKRLQNLRNRTGWTTAGAIYRGGRDGWLPVRRLRCQRLAPGQDAAAARRRVSASLLWPD